MLQIAYVAERAMHISMIQQEGSRNLLRMLTSEWDEWYFSAEFSLNECMRYSQLGSKNMYWKNEVNMCQGSKCKSEPMR